MQTSEKTLGAEVIASHRSVSSCWIVVDDKVYDVTSYMDRHPGGAAILLKQGGTVSNLILPVRCSQGRAYLVLHTRA
jgi:hypothetical protein